MTDLQTLSPILPHNEEGGKAKIRLWPFLCIIFLFSLITSAVAQSSSDSLPIEGKELPIPDIDQWQILKDETAKDPFAHKNQFTINFKEYTEDKDWAYPLPGGKVISPYGGNRHHGGTDIKTFPNDTIRAAFPGHVTLSGPHYAYGNAVIIRHANGLETLYSHQSKNLCKKGDWVWAGQPIGLTGRTGRATTEHLHFETRVNGKSFDSARLYDHANHRLWPYLFVFTKKKSGVKITFKK